jgi:hypothetical protein
MSAARLTRATIRAEWVSVSMRRQWTCVLTVMFAGCAHGNASGAPSSEALLTGPLTPAQLAIAVDVREYLRPSALRGAQGCDESRSPRWVVRHVGSRVADGSWFDLFVRTSSNGLRQVELMRGVAPGRPLLRVESMPDGALYVTRDLNRDGVRQATTGPLAAMMAELGSLGAAASCE